MSKKKRKSNKKQKKTNFWGKIFFCFVMAIVVYFGINTFSFAQTLKFAQISDVHLSNKNVDTSYKVLASSQELFEDAIEQINEVPNIDFVIETGDLVDKPRKELVEKACKQLNKLNTPWYFAFGNHDAAIGTTFNKDEYFAFIKDKNSNITSSKRYYSFVPKNGYRVIVLDSTIDTRITANGEIPEEQLEWLDTELSKAKLQQQIPLIFMHNPLQEPFPSFHHRLLNAQELQAILDKYEMPIAIFTGHYHAAKIYKDGNILHVSTPSLVTYPNAFRIITINNLKDKVIFTFDFRETRLKEIQKKAKLMTFSASTLKGEEGDRNTVVIMQK